MKIIIDRMHGDKTTGPEITNAAAADSSQAHLDEKKENLQPDKMVGPAQLLAYRLRVLAAFLPAPELEVRRQHMGVVQPPSSLPAARRNAAAPATELAAEAAADSTGPRDLINCKLQIPKHQKASPDTTPVLTNALQAQQ